MSGLDALRVIGSAALLSGLIPLLIFIALYGFRSPWRSSPEGRNLMRKETALAAIIAVGIATVFLPENWVLYVIRLVVYVTVVVSFWIDVVQLRRVQKKHPRK